MAVKTKFGSWLSHVLRGGVSLKTSEVFLLVKLVEHSPARLRPIIEAQFDIYNLVQREIDGRALNFYAVGGGKVHSLPTFQMQTETMKLCHAKASFDGMEVNSTLTAVSGRAFCISLDKRIDRLAPVRNMQLLQTTTTRI